MKILDRHVAREVLGPFTVAVLTFVVLVIGHLLFQVITTVVERGVPLWAVARFVGYQVPFALGLALPVSVLLASALAVHRLARDNELTPMRAAGVSVARVLWPTWLLGLGVAGLSFLVAEYVEPKADRRAEGIVADMPLSRPTLALRPGKFTTATEDVCFLPGTVDDQTGTVRDLKAFWVEPGGTVTLVEAERARIRRSKCIVERVRTYRLDERGNLTTGPAYRGTIDLPGTLATFTGEQRTQRNMSVGELLRRIRQASGPNPETTRSLRLELHSRLGLAFACLAFALLGGPVALAFRDGKSIGGVLAVVLFGFVYYVGMLWARMLGESAVLPPVAAAWLPNLVTMAVGVVLVWRRS